MQSVSQILGEKRHYQKWLNEAEILANLRKNSTDLLGQLSDHIHFGFVQDRVLILETQQYAWVNEINFFKPQLIEKINTVLGKKNTIKDIKIRVQTSIPTEDRLNSKSSNELTLEEKIKNDYAEKLKQGWKVCSKCTQTFSKHDPCLFCS